jgi:hypothetical protein
MRLIAISLISALLVACASAKVSSLPVTTKVHVAVKVIALAPDGGLLADAVGVELANRGYTIIDTASMSKMMVRLGINEVEVQMPEGLSKLKAQGIDAWLSVRSAGGNDGAPQSASARMNSTETGQIIAGVTWQNGWGGVSGSIADRTMRSGLTDAARQIADALVARLK